MSDKPQHIPKRRHLSAPGGSETALVEQARADALIAPTGRTVARKPDARRRQLDRMARIRRDLALLAPDRIGATLWTQLALEQDRWFLWVPVCMAAGIGSYFALPREPSLIALCLLACLASGLAIGLRNRAEALLILVALAAVLVGAARVSIDAHRLDGPEITSRTFPVTIVGQIRKLDASASGRPRAVVQLQEIQGWSAQTTPRRVRISLFPRNRGQLHIGMGIKVRAILLPASEAHIPGGFDFSRMAYFMGLGGTGFAVGQFETVDLPKTTGRWLLDGAALQVENLRQTIATRIRTSLDGDAAAISVALITGDRSGITDSIRDKLRSAGLAHILAISGLHMVLVAGSVFFGLRAGLALIPGVALRFPLRKIAAMAGLCMALVYLVVSGASVATQRAFVMTAIVFLAILMDRPALTLRAVAIAALIVLLIRPYSAVEAGFQMSFAATLALIAGYRAVRDRKQATDPDNRHWMLAPLRWSSKVIKATIFTAILAGFATAPIAAHHFGVTAPYTVLGNALAMPLFSSLVMPGAVISVILMPLGLDPLILPFVGVGLDQILSFSGWIAQLPQARYNPGHVSAGALLVFAGGALWLVLWQTQWRWLGLSAWPVALFLVITAPIPDILIDHDGRMVVMRTPADNPIELLATSRSKFTLQGWIALFADPRKPDDRAFADAVCGEIDKQPDPCLINADLASGAITIAIERRGDDIGRLCALADIVVLPRLSPRGYTIPIYAGQNRDAESCAGRLIIDRETLTRRGAIALQADHSSDPRNWKTIGASDQSRYRLWGRTANWWASKALCVDQYCR